MRVGYQMKVTNFQNFKSYGTTTNYQSVNKNLSLNQQKNEINENKNIPNLQALRANYALSFTGKTDFPFSLDKEITLDVPFYDSNADDLAILLGPDKNVIVKYSDNTASPHLLLEKFKTNLQNGKYKREGFDPDKTKVIEYDYIVKDSGKTIHECIEESLGNLSNNKKAIVFIPDSIKYFQLFESNKVDLKNSMKQKYFGDNVQIVGFIDNAHYNHYMNLMAGNLDKDFLKMFGKLDLKVPGEKDTKIMLKKEPALIRKITENYRPMRVLVSDNAINEVVDKTSRGFAGEFPGKALRMLDYVIAAKANEIKKKNEKTPLMVSSSDVKRFFVRHPEIVETLKESNGQFNVAEIPKTKLTDVGGLEEVKDVLDEGILAYIKNPQEYLKSGKKPPKGVLFYGDPGTGKTLLARAIAGETEVPFFNVSGSEFVEKFVGVGAQRVRELFANARKAANASDKKTAIIFIDEIDTVGKKREGDSNGTEAGQTLNQLLASMDGFNNDPKCSVIVIGATNRLDMLDSALTRPGRFDDKLEVPNPSNNKAGRLEILKIHSKDKPFKNEKEKMEILDEAATISSGLSGAEIADMMQKAVNIIIKRDNDKFITPNDIVEGFLQVKAGPIRKSDESDHQKIVTVAHECGHALVGKTINDLAKQPWKKIHDISFITLDQRGSFLGAVFFKPGQNKPSINFDFVVSQAALYYAGGITESMYLDGRHEAGVSKDLEYATDLIEKGVIKWGLGPNTKKKSIKNDSPLSKMYEAEIKTDINIFSETAEKISELITDFNKDFIDEYVNSYKEYLEYTKKNSGKHGKGGYTLSGEGFKELHDEWLERTGKDKELPILEKKIDILITAARKGEILSDEQLNNKLLTDSPLSTCITVKEECEKPVLAEA